MKKLSGYCKEKSEEELVKAATKLSKAGNLSKAVKLISSTNHVRVAGTENSRKKLRLKHPIEGLNNLTPMQVNQLNSFRQENNNDIELIEANEFIIEDIIRESKNCKSHGLDHFRAEHLKQLYFMFDCTSLDVMAFRSSFTDLITAIINGRVPLEAQFFFQGFELIAIPKGEKPARDPDSDVRPIGLQSML